MRYGIVEYAHHFIEEQVQQGDICIDATAGNGNDTSFLCELVGESGHEIAMDIQPMAVDNTKALLQDRRLAEWAEVILASHVTMEQYAKAESVACVVFNLGYLPGGDHNLATKGNTSIEAMEAALRLLKRNGLLSVTIYSGGDSGFAEKEEVLAWLKSLDSKKYLVITSEYYNRPNNPPMPVQVIKL